MVVGAFTLHGVVSAIHIFQSPAIPGISSDAFDIKKCKRLTFPSAASERRSSSEPAAGESKETKNSSRTPEKGSTSCVSFAAAQVLWCAHILPSQISTRPATRAFPTS